MFKKIIIHKELHKSKSSSGNSIPLDNIELLGVNFDKDLCEENINSTTTGKARISDFLEEINEDNLELEEIIFDDYEFCGVLTEEDWRRQMLQEYAARQRGSSDVSQ